MILKTSPNGKLRLRRMKNGKDVVEIKGHDGTWVWCVCPSLELAQAEALFDDQVKFHQAEE